MDRNGCRRETQAATAGVLDLKYHAHPAEACLCDAELPPDAPAPPSEREEEASASVSGTLADMVPERSTAGLCQAPEPGIVDQVPEPEPDLSPGPGLGRGPVPRQGSGRAGQSFLRPATCPNPSPSPSQSGIRSQSRLRHPPPPPPPLQQQQQQQQQQGQGLKREPLPPPPPQQQQQQQQQQLQTPVSLCEPPAVQSYCDISGDASGDAAAAAAAAAAAGGDRSHPCSQAWMDAGSVWSSVQRHGEELQRRQRAAAAAAASPPRRRLSFVSAAGAGAAAAAAAWWRGPLKRFLQHVRTQVIVTARVVAKDPYTVVVPLLLLVAMLALGLWGTFSVANAIRDGRRQAALNSATDFAATLKSHIAATVAPASTFKTLIEMNPSWTEVNRTFHERAPALVQKGRMNDAVLTIVLCPQGIAAAIVPWDLPAWGQVYGLNLLRETAWRSDALKTVSMHDSGMVMTGPSRLRAGMMGIVTRYAVFVPGGPNETFGFSGGSAHNCSQCYEPPAPGSDPGAVGMRFWGFAQLNVDWNVLLHNVTQMYDLCERDGLNFNMTYIEPVNKTNVSIANCTLSGRGGGSGGGGGGRGGGLGPNPILVNITTMQNSWVLAVTDARGWTPDWLPLVVAAVVVVSLWVAVAMAIILINRREHMWLLQAMLPKKVIATLRRGEEYAEAFECVTVLFSDIVSYTTLASEMEPIKVVRLLNEMYSEFDALVDQFECYKVETIGDAFMAVSGTQGEDALAAAVKVARLAQAMIERTRVLVSADGQKIQIRIGLHSGPVVGAVVGFKMPHFCLCGDTVNTASRMESNSKPMRIHVSDSTAALLEAAAAGEGFQLERRGVIQVKGKGPMETHWLLPPSGRYSGGGGAATAAATVSAATQPPPTEEDGSKVEGTVMLKVMEAGPAAAAAGAEEPPPALVDSLAEAAAAVAGPETPSPSPAPWASAARAAASSLCGTPFPSPAGGAAAAAAAGGGPSPSSWLGMTASNARRRFSEAGSLNTASYGQADGGGGGSTGGGSGGGGSGGLTMTCSGSGAAAATAAAKKPRTSVDLRLFQARQSRGR
ncbi:hypothetical protein PLESTF_000894800 [Pleodorina starrii]|nr:hypothetical protein PLESTF_000894800 [Pleodorina starrii]